MRNKRLTGSLAGCALIVSAFGMVETKADTSLFEWGLNQDGVITGGGDPLPAGSVFDLTEGLGTVRLTFIGAGAHSGVLFVDHELSEASTTFFNELGTATGAPAAGQSWEIDEPGFSAFPGDIFDNFLADTLDNSVGKVDPDDVSMAMGWSFLLTAGQTGTVLFSLSESKPNGGFYLTHSDPDSGEDVYFASSLRISGGGGVVPEGQTIAAGSVLALLIAFGAWRNRRTGETQIVPS